MTRQKPKEAALTEEDICQRVRDSVLEQRLAPGTKLTEESLCGVFGVGRTTVRRAFLLLSRDNIVELQKNKGAVIASPSPDEAQQVFEARHTVEAALLARASEVADTNDIKNLRGHLAQERDALAKADIARWIRLTGEFHLHVAKLAGNTPMYHFLEQLVFRSSLIITLYGRHGQSVQSCTGDEHTRLVDALERRDIVAAQEILTHHLNDIEATLRFERAAGGDDLHQIFGMARAS
ncbi:GntR family transcriptional regulator [Kordiimonas sp.]|uniref:GntR family transcriptional regulator n=1 Tax=Kordiimonas sp. TaxID=1970157 RepID=UPI003A957B56